MYTLERKQEMTHETKSRGRFGIHGGQYIPETLMNAVIELEEAYNRFKDDPKFQQELETLFNDYAGRPSLLYFAEKMTKDLGGAKIYLKREDLNHTGAHKINNVLGQALLAKRMGKTRLIAETGAGQHGVALATAAAYFGLECDIYMGEVDIAKQAPNVTRMKILGANVIPVSFGLKTLKEAVDAAFMAYSREYKDAVYCIGTAAGPHPFPLMVRDFQYVIGEEARAQFLEQTGHLPDQVTACVGGGSNAIGMFTPFLRFVAFLLTFIVLHELIHGLSWSLFCPNGFKDIQFGVMKQYLTPYCTCLVPLSKGAYIFGAVMPLVILGIVPMIAGIVTGDWSVELMGIIMADSAAGDIMIVRDILRYRSTAEEVVYIDHPTQAGGVIFER